MTARAKFRGHAIHFDEAADTWRYKDGEPVPEGWTSRGCGHCGLPDTPEGHDACLGTLPGPVMNACCGHGVVADAYVQFLHSETLRGEDAVAWQEAHKVNR